MVKIIFRLHVLSCVCVLIAGGVYQLVESNPQVLGLNAGPGAGKHMERAARNGGTAGESSLPQFEPGSLPDINEHPSGPVEGEMGSIPTGLAALGIVRSLVIIAIITLTVLGLQQLFKLIFHKRLPKAVQIEG